MSTLSKSEQRTRRHKRIRMKIAGTSKRPRLAIFRSNKVMYAQLIDDSVGGTIGSASSKGMKGGMHDAAKKVGVEIAKIAKQKKIDAVVFDRGGFTYTGTIKALAEGAREGGLSF